MIWQRERGIIERAVPLLAVLLKAGGGRRREMPDRQQAGYNSDPISGPGVQRKVGEQGCQMEKFHPFLSLHCARMEGVGAQSKEGKGSSFAA